MQKKRSSSAKWKTTMRRIRIPLLTVTGVVLGRLWLPAAF